MRTNIVLDDKLMAEAMRVSSAKTKREVVDIALRQLVARHRQRKLKQLVGRDLIEPTYDVRQTRRNMGHGSG